MIVVQDTESEVVEEEVTGIIFRLKRVNGANRGTKCLERGNSHSDRVTLFSALVKEGNFSDKTKCERKGGKEEGPSEVEKGTQHERT